MRALHVLLFALCASPVWAGELPQPPADFEAHLVDLAERARQRTVLVYGLIGLGSGGVVSHDGVVVTNAHVVAGARYAVVQWADGSTTLMRRRGIDYGRDLAVLEPAEPLGRWTPAFAIRSARPAEGEWVMTVGFPGGPRGNFDATVTVGRVQAADAAAPQSVGGVLDYGDAIIHDAPIFSGNSGGPLVDMQGRFVGVNGAGDLQRATSMAIPAERVLDRLQTLRDELILLPGDRRFEPNGNPLTRALYRALDSVAQRLPTQTATAARQRLQGLALPEGEALEAWVPNVDAERLAHVAREGTRQGALRPVATPGSATLWLGDLPATRIGANHAVCKGSRVGNRTSLELPEGLVRVVAISTADDLALLALPAGLAGEAPTPAGHRAPGAIVCVPDRDGVIMGFVSADRRPTSATLAAEIAAGGVPTLVLGLIERLEGLAARLNSAELEALVAQLRQAIALRRSFSSGTPPHSYPSVLSIDAPLAPSQAGAPALDHDGHLIGVTVGLPHHGTAYVVPLDRVLQVFRAELGGAPVVPAQRGSAKLY